MVNNKRKKIKLFLFIVLINSFIFFSFAGVSSKELIENPDKYNQKEIIYRGEAIGEVMTRKDYSWINVKDKYYAIGIWAKKELTKDIITGDYKKTGDILEIKGIFNKSCSLHGGDLDIHASEIKILERAKKRKIKLDIKKIKVLIVLILVFLLEVLFLWKKKSKT